MRLVSRDDATGKSIIELDKDDVALIMRKPENPNDKPGIEFIMPIPDPTALVPTYICALANVARRFNRIADSIRQEAIDYRLWVIEKRRNFSHSAWQTNRKVTMEEIKKLNEEVPL